LRARVDEAGGREYSYGTAFAVTVPLVSRLHISSSIISRQFAKLVPVPVDDLIRLGRDFDGGYVVSERTVACADFLIGLGINDDWSFEADFVKRRPGTPLIAVDGSVSRGSFRREALDRAYSALRALLRSNLPATRTRLAESRQLWHTASAFHEFFRHPQRKFVEEMLAESAEGPFDWQALMRMVDADAPGASRLFIKMDIEGAEYRVLPELLTSADRIAAIVIEFHSCDLLWERLMEVMETMLTRFVIVHTHGNNCAPLIANSGIPRVLEISLANRDLVSAGELARRNDREYPLPGLDMPNEAGRPDYALRFGDG
jgi:hypothetical protein